MVIHNDTYEITFSEMKRIEILMYSYVLDTSIRGIFHKTKSFHRILCIFEYEKINLIRVVRH